MAIKLVARMSLVDKFTNPMRKIEQQVNRNQNAVDRMKRSVDKSGRSMVSMTRNYSRLGVQIDRFGKGIFSAGKGIVGFLGKLNPLSSGLLGIASAAGAAYSAVKLFNATVGEAMKMQQSQVVIGAMFDDKKLSSEYMKMMDKIAIKSPLLDSQTMYSNSKSFITASKDLKQLEKMWDLAERLVASDPQQGLEGAIFALRELFSGDAISIVDRFEMPRTIMNEIKKLPLEKQLVELDKYFNKIGITTKLIDDMGSTALGTWQQVKERMQLRLRDMGEPSLNAVSKFLNGVLDRLEGDDMTKFANWGGRVIENMVTGLSDGAIRLYDWFTNLANDPEFKKRTTITGKVMFVMDDIADKLREWYDGGGKEKIIKFGSGAAEVLVGAFDNTPAFTELGVKMGMSLVDGVFQGIQKSAKESAVGQGILNALRWNPIGMAQNVSTRVFNKVNDSFSKDKKTTRPGGQRSHASGLDYVPFNDYPANLHRGEAVLSAEENKQYQKGKFGGGLHIENFNYHSPRGNVKEDAKAILEELARLIELEGGLTT